MPRILLILVFLISSYSCTERQRAGSGQPQNGGAIDTLPNGKTRLDTYDSAMSLYYKEIVGSDTLSNGGITCYGVDDSMRYFYLRRGDSMYLLNKSTIYQSPWSLGVLDEEFTHFFTTRLDNGNSTPISYQAFDKQSGRNLLGEGIRACSYISLNDTLFMLVDRRAQTSPDIAVSLWNTSTGRKENFDVPGNLPEFCDIQITRLTKKYIHLSFQSYMGDPYEMVLVCLR